MTKILVPVDFTFNSLAAYKYAMHLANDMNAEVVLLHVVSGSFSTNTMLAFEPLHQLDDAMKERLRYFAFEYPEEEGIAIPNVDVSLEVKFGIAGFTIAEYAEKFECSLMVLGTKDQYGILDKLMGSTTSVLITLSTIPMIIVNERTEYVRPSGIVFGFDGRKDIDQGIRFLKQFNIVFGASVTFIHVRSNASSQLKESIAELVDIMTEDYDVYYPFTIKELKSKHVSSALIDYCFQSKADMLMVYHRKSGFLERLFKKSYSKKLSKELHLPVLIIPEMEHNS